MEIEEQAIIAQAREACPGCPYFAVCPLAPLFLQSEAPPGDRKPHPHGRTLQHFLERLRQATPRFERALLTAMGGEEEGNALVAGCMFAQAFFNEPERLRRLLEGINSRGPAPRPLSTLEEHVQRAAALTQDPGVPPLLRGRFRLRRPDREVTAYEATRLVTRLMGGEAPAVWWLEAVPEEDRPAFEASFALRQKSSGEGSDAGSGALDLFLSARTSGRSMVFYYRRNAEGRHAIVPIEGVRSDSLLRRTFKVFDTDRRKTHRLFAKICRHLNNGFKGLDKRMLWEGLKRLDREQLVVLALYAPRLAKYIEKRAEFPGLYRLVKFLHRNVEDETGYSHQKVYERRDQVGAIVETYGKDRFKELCRAVFRIAEAYRPGPESASLIYKVAEVAYFLTAVQGFNARGLELSLAGKNPLAFIAYGLQPPARSPARRVHRLRHARLVHAAEGDSNGLLAAIDQGMAYMAAIHGFDSVAALERAADQAPPDASARDSRPSGTSRPEEAVT